MLKKYLLMSGAILLLNACGEPQDAQIQPAPRQVAKADEMQEILPAGMWRGVIHTQGKELPFQMSVSWLNEKPAVDFLNGEEAVAVETVKIEKDAVNFILPAFNTRIEASKSALGELQGTLFKVTINGVQQMPVTLTHGQQYRFFELFKPSDINVSGRWEVTFTEPDGKTYPAVGEFVQQGSQVFGTFLTLTSDYRYLAGAVRDGRLHLSAWDGYHVFLFEADVQEDGSLKGDFWSGESWHETWTATRNPDAELADMDKQTYLKPGYETFDFTFPNPEGAPVSLSDPRFAGKAVVVQLAGSWCPNCADETRFLAPWYKENRERGVEVVALMFEHFEDFDKAATQVRAWREKYGVEYPALVAGLSDKAEAGEKLPQLNAFLAFPTTIFIAPDGEVVRIHTGFNGPATGERYEEEIRKFNATVDAMLAAPDVD